MDFVRFELDNGLRVIHKPVRSPVAHLGIILNVGSRDEDIPGMAHLIEHCIFKGTKSRKAYHVLSRLDDVNGDLNAFTTKEDTCIYASFTDIHYERAIELITDIAFNSVFPEKEIAKEKEVIIDEINSYKDNPAEEIFDDFDERFFKNHPLGARITGTPESIKTITKEQIIQFVTKHYFRNDMVISSVGSIDADKLKALLNRYIGHIPLHASKSKRKPFKQYKAFTKSIKRKNHQSHCAIGNLAFSLKHAKKTPMFLLTNVLGGPGLNTRLNLNIRERYGFCYHIEASYSPYSDSGIFTIYFGTDNDYLEKTISLVNKELQKLRDTKLGVLQLHKARQQLLGQIAIAQDSNITEMLSLGKSLLTFDKVDDFSEMKKRIEKVEAKHILAVANEVFAADQLSTLVYRP